LALAEFIIFAKLIRGIRRKKEKGIMSPRSIFRNILRFFLILFFAGIGLAQMIDLCLFKGVQISHRLKYQDSIIEKGTYDIEALKNPNTPMCYLRIKKGKKIFCLAEGERLQYEGTGMDQMSNPSIPDEPTLKIKRDPIRKKLFFIVETGKRARFPFYKLSFTLEIIEGD
jgi:hypothetical protein